jgi:hypothetical protein
MPGHNPAGFAAALRRGPRKLYPELERAPDLTRAQQRFAAEVALAWSAAS